MHVVRWITFDRLDEWQSWAEVYEDKELAWLRYLDLMDMYKHQGGIEDMAEVTLYLEGEPELDNDVQFSDNKMKERMGIDG
jgi:hypothetical protein